MHEFLTYEMCQRTGADNLTIFVMTISTHSYLDNVTTKFMINKIDINNVRLLTFKMNFYSSQNVRDFVSYGHC